MARRLFFVPEVHSGRAELRGEDARHMSKVLRVERGEVYEISDNQRRYLAEVEASHKDLVAFRVLEPVASPVEACRITLAMALVKFDRFEWIVEKATELGVHTVQPFWCDRSEQGLEKAAHKRVERWRKIGLEAAQQCRRTFLPVIEEPVSFAQAIREGKASPAEASPAEATTAGNVVTGEIALGREDATARSIAAGHAAVGARYFLDEAATGAPFAPVAADSVVLMVGPEGGWTERERAAAAAAQWTTVSLGPRILRAETAAMAALAVLSIR